MPPTRALMAAHALHYLVRGGKWHADLKLLSIEGALWVVKDFSGKPWWVRWTLGLWLIHRELRAFRALQGIEGIPRSVSRLDIHALAYRYVDGTTLSRIPPARLTKDFFQAYEALLDAVHARGILHLSLGDGANILVTPGQRPVLIDFQRHVALPRWCRHLATPLGNLDFRSFNGAWNRYQLAQLQREVPSVPVSRRP